MTGIFFPQREALRLDSENLTPRARRKVVHAGGNAKSFGVGSQSLCELAEWELRTPRVADQTLQAGREMKKQQTAKVDEYHQRDAKRPLTEPCPIADDVPENMPEVGVAEMDGGRLRTRQEDSPRGVKDPHWREFQAACVVRLQSDEVAEDPRPEVPALFLCRPKVQKLVNQLHRQKKAGAEPPADGEETSIGEILAEASLTENAAETVSPGIAADTEPSNAETDTQEETAKPKRPIRLQRTCVATLEGADACGRILASEAASRGLHQARRKGFVGDGMASIWAVWERYFKPLDYVGILDFIHLLSYAYGIAMAVGHDADDSWQRYVGWITALWEGRGAEVLSEWRSLADAYDVPATGALPDRDLRRPIQRAVTYLSNNIDRVDYPRYRRLGLPVTSTLMESLVKEFNHRVKGTEKFWNDPSGAEAILTVRAALLSEDNRFAEFFAVRPGCRYRRRSTLEAEKAKLAAAG